MQIASYISHNPAIHIYFVSNHPFSARSAIIILGKKDGAMAISCTTRIFVRCLGSLILSFLYEVLCCCRGLEVGKARGRGEGEGGSAVWSLLKKDFWGWYGVCDIGVMVIVTERDGCEGGVMRRFWVGRGMGWDGMGWGLRLEGERRWKWESFFEVGLGVGSSCPIIPRLFGYLSMDYFE